MRFIRKLYLLVLTLLVSAGLVVAQDECPDIVDDALFSLSEICLATGRNEACYGNGQIVAIPQSNATIDFDAPGDVSNVDDIDTLTLAPFQTNLDEWGVAVLVVQADIPDTLPGQNVTMLLFGDTNLANDNGAYYFSSGIGTPDCNQAPNGILIQTPEGAGQVTLTMNGIDISIGSTAYLSSLDDDELLIALLEGVAELATDENTVELITEQFTTILIDEDGNATGEFAEPASTDELDLPALPLDLLPESLEDDGETETSDTSSAPSGDVIIPTSGPWSSTLGDFNFGEGCPAMFVDAFNAQQIEQFGVSDGMTQEIVFDDEDVLGPLFLDLAAPAFESEGANLTVDDSTPNVYRVTISIDGAAVINYTWTVVSETRIEAEIFQEIEIPQASCSWGVPVTIEYQG